MTKPIQEALPAGADAIPRATVEVSSLKGKWQVRGKDRQGYAFRQDFSDPDLAMEYFWQKADSLVLTTGNGQLATSSSAERP